MAKYILDTTLLIDHLRGRNDAQELVDALASEGHRLGVCCVSVAELYSGLGPDEQETASDLTDSLEYFEVSLGAAREAGRYRYESARRGTTLSTSDTLIAATAIEEDAILITDNIKDFPMREIRLFEQA